LRPSQLVLGMIEVENKVKRIKAFTSKQLKKYLADHVVPLVKIDKELYILDHHHFVRACWEAGIKKVAVKVVQKINKPKQSQLEWMYLVDQFGRKHNVADHALLPLDVRGLADDPYRSLAWAVREAGGFDKVVIPFSEFKWANYFRGEISIQDLRSNFKGSVRVALKLCKQNSAAKLPGYKR